MKSNGRDVFVAKIIGLLFVAAALISPMWLSRSTAVALAQSQPPQHRHRHMKNWMLEPTGIPGVFPLDPTTIPQFVNQLTKPPVHVPVGTQREPKTGNNLPLYEVHEKAIQAQILPPGFPTTKVYAYGGRVNFSESGQPANIQTAFTVPGPTFEAVRNQRIFVHYVNDLDGDLIFPVDPTIMGANVNKARIPTPPFQLFPPGYEQFQNPIPTVAHLHGGVTPPCKCATVGMGS